MGFAFKRAVLNYEGIFDYESIINYSVNLPNSLFEFCFPTLSLLHTQSRNPISFPLELDRMVDKIFSVGVFLEKAVSYYCDLLRTEPERDIARRLVASLAEVSRLRPPQNDLREALKTGLDLASGSCWHATEGIGLRAEDEAGKLWVQGAIDATVRAKVARVGAEAVTACWSPSLPDGDDLQLSEYVSGLRPNGYVPTILRAITGESSNDHARLVVGGPPLVPKPISNLSGSAAESDHIFVSYAHIDSNFSNAVELQLQSLGLSFWLDQHISAGEIWDETLEKKLRTCRIFLALVSINYERSKYCRREIKFADLYGKFIIPIAIEDYIWGSGLRLMFQELQIARCSGVGQLPDEVVKRLKSFRTP
jgi:hypothetical protein